MKFFALVRRPEGDNATEFDVPSQEHADLSIQALGYSYEFISEADYQKWVAAHKVVR